MARHEPTQADFTAALKLIEPSPRATLMQARFVFGKAAEQCVRANELDAAEMTITNLRLLKEQAILDGDDWKRLDEMRTEGNRAYHVEECKDLTQSDADDYAARVEQAILDDL